MTRSQYDGTTFNSFDVDLFPLTSLISTSRDTARIPTTYIYDTLGRVTKFILKAPRGRSTNTTYRLRQAAFLL